MYDYMPHRTYIEQWRANCLKVSVRSLLMTRRHIVHWARAGKLPPVPVHFTYDYTSRRMYIEQWQAHCLVSQYALLMTIRHIIHWTIAGKMSQYVLLVTIRHVVQ